MRNMSGRTWATMVVDGRRRKQLTQQGLADLLGIDRTTVWRWERGGVKPDDPEMVRAVALALGENEDEAHQLAGLALPSSSRAEAETDPRLRGLDPADPVVRKIMALDVDEQMRGWMLDRHRQNLERDRQRYLEDLERDAEMLRRQRGAA